ncbi:terpene synthase family protein [Streptomyces sp. NPDC021100]|uniref:terpene synthase family protein n=1 Tax=Streptomyces sp. NPDC021100 TaxID=3365114 RepID=UPI0037A49AE6
MFEVPNLTLPFEVHKHPREKTLREHERKWLEASGLLETRQQLDHYLNISMAAYTAYMCPHAQNIERLSVLVEYNNWLMLFDDLFEQETAGDDHLELEAVAREVIAIMSRGESRRATPPPMSALGTRLVELFKSIWKGVHELAPSDWSRRHTQSAIEFMLYNRPSDVASRPRDFEESWRRRRIAFGCFPLAELVEFGNDSYLPEVIFECSPFGDLKRAYGDLQFLPNDFVSLRKELQTPEPDNVIILLRERYGCTWQEAVDRAALIFDEALAAFSSSEVEVEHCLRGLGIDEAAQRRVLSHIEELKYFLAGSLHWHMQNARYGLGDL